MNRIDRLLGLLTFLQSRKYTPAEKIADKFGISIRTVYRDIKALAEQGVPVSFEPNRGYFIVEGYFLPPVSFTSEEANALLLMESIVQGFSDRSIQKHYSTALNKVKSVLQPRQLERIEVLADNIKVQVPDCFRQDFEYLTVIQNAISGKTIIELQYHNTKKETSRRTVEPLGLIFYAFNWHLIGWCHIRKDYRDFRVSRIQNIRNTDQPFVKQQHILLADYMKQLPVEF